MKEQDLGDGGTKESRVHVQIGFSGWIEAFEAERDLVVPEGIVIGSGNLLVVADEPELRLRVCARQVGEALRKVGPIRFAGARDFDHSTRVALSEIPPFHGGDQACGRNFVLRPGKEGIRYRPHELGLPPDHMLAVREIAPARIAVERGVVADPREQPAGRLVVEANASERFLA